MKIDPQDDAGHGRKPFACPLLRNELRFYLRANCLCHLNLNLFAKPYVKCEICSFSVCGSSRWCPSRTHRSGPVKKHISRIYFFTDPFGGSASVPARAGPQKWFCVNCKRVLRADGMRGVLELLLVSRKKYPLFNSPFFWRHRSKE